MNRLVNIISIISLILTLGFGSALAQTRGPKIKGNVYGGGENAKVAVVYTYEEYKALDGNGDVTESEFDALPLEQKIKPVDGAITTVTINNGNVKGDVFGAGKGVTVGKTPATGTDGNGDVINPLTYDKIAVVYGDTKVEIKNVADTDKKGTVWGNIYGGAENAIVDGNANVYIAGGNFASDVFGGGKGDVTGSDITAANVLKNTYVSVTSGEIVWNKKLDSNWEIVDAASAEYFDREDNKFLTDHNIYAGGDIACTIGTWNAEGTKLDDRYENTGTSTLTMTRGLLNKDLLTSEEWKQAFAEHENPHFYAFGGGYGIYTKAHKSDVKILLPMFSEEGTGGGDQQLARPYRTSGGAELPMPIITDNYGVAWTTVLGILGGGYNGHVEETNVLVGDATYAHRVYGGGLGSYDGWVEASADSKTPNTEAAGYVGTTGKLPLTTDPAADLQTTHVTLAGGHIYGDVFGGGAGVASGKKGVDDNSKPILDRTAANTEFTDFTEIARVKGNTKVETTSYETYLTSKGTKETVLASHPNKNANTDPDEKKQQAYPLYQRAQIFGNVYGGGDVANVSGNTNVSLFGGDVFGYTFGAGLGRLTTEAKDYTTIGNVSGNSTLTIADLVDWTGDWKTSYTEPYQPTAWDDIYGGGRNGVTNGNAEVNINGGKLGNNIFGGGLGNVDGTNITSADVKGNTTVTVTGGEYQWREIADVNGNIKTFNDVAEEFDRSIIYNRMKLTPLMEHVKDFFNYNTASYTRDHSIYGGGNIACKVGTYVNDDDDDDVDLLDAPTSGGKATVDMQHGLFADTDIHWTDDDKWNLATLCRWLACENSSNYQFGVFGGGYGANTKVGSTQVDLHMGASDANKAKWNTYMTAINNEYLALDKQTQDDYYGGGVGENAKNRYLTARMARSINVPSHTVLTTAGGGLAGYVAGNTSVHQYERSGSLRVFGGGIGLRPSDNELKTLDADGAAAMTYGQVGGNTTVDVEYGVVIKDVYGGGAGVESLQNNSGNYVDFTNMARVKGRTDVRVHTKEVNNPSQTLIYGMVFGGGDVANVGDPATKVTTDMQATHIIDDENEDKLCTKVIVDAGCVFKEVFAGGSGRTANYCADYENLGAVYGNTQLVINQNGENSTWLWNDVYGGGRNGIVYGNTLVDIEGGWLGNNVFGGGLGNLDTKTDPVSGLEEEVITKANVTRNTNIQVRGGQYCLSQSWDEVTRNWNPLKKDASDNPYSPQYDPATNKFLLSHNIYGGGNVACVVGNDTWVDMTKGLLPAKNRLGRDNTLNLFTEAEWVNIHNKHASAYFSVFGGGYGENTVVENNSNITIDMQGDIEPNHNTDPKNLSSIFYDRQSVLDVIGGGYEGAVTNTCNIDIKGNSFMRNVFGGAYYATVGGTVINVERGNIENIYGGGMMGDVRNAARINVGQEYTGTDDAKSTDNAQLIILQNIYGGNDVSGMVGAVQDELGVVTATPGCDGVVMNLYGGRVLGNVYGSGNGNYQYKLTQEVTKVTPMEDYEFKAGDRDAEALVFFTPVRETDFPSFSAMSPAQKIVNISSYRPGVSKVSMNIKGNSTTDRLLVDGAIYGGGNSATVSTFAVKNDGTTPDYGVKMNLGSHVKAGSLFFGSDGTDLFNTDNYFISNFEALNELSLRTFIDWSQAENINIPLQYLPVEAEKRPEIYENLLDLYFLPVEMDFMPEFTWNGKNNTVNLAKKTETYQEIPDDETGITDVELGTFCCGGNRGNMNTDTHFHVNFPEGLTITDKIVGGCNNANYDYLLEEKDPLTGLRKTLVHRGGYLLGSHGVGGDNMAQIHLTLRNKFKNEAPASVGAPYAEACNVFGGCYESGVIRGDVLIESFSNMLMSEGENGDGLNIASLKAANENNTPVASIYGGGYGPGTYVYGDTDVRIGNATDPHSSNIGAHDVTYNVTGSSCNFIFGGGCQGNIVGNTNVRVYNGRIAGCVVGASFKGSLYGNAQTMVGYPERYYRVNDTGVFHLNRVDNDKDHADYHEENGKLIINPLVYYTKGDLVPVSVYEEIDRVVTESVDAEGNITSTLGEPLTADQKKALFTMEHSIPGEEFKTTEPAKFNDWSNVNILVDKAIYGGGYAIMDGENSDPFTVKKYVRAYRFTDDQLKDIYNVNDTILFNNYGGNTFVILGDISGDYEKQAVADGESALADMSTRDSSNPNKITAEGQRNRDHITISSRQLDPITTTTGDDLFGLFYELTNLEKFGEEYATEHHWTDEQKQAGSGSYMKVAYEAIKEASDNHQYYEFIGEGGVYGDGRLSLSEGFRTCEAIGYGYNGSSPDEPKLMNCVHRFDIVRFKDCCISLLGDRDYASVEGQMANAAAYSIARVSEINMESSIDQTCDYLAKNEKFSRNYVGLSNAQFDLAAIRSNVDFIPKADGTVPENARYHNKSGKVIYTGMDVEGSEDNNGVAQTKFTDQESYYDVKRWYLNEYKIGSGKSDYYDNIVAQVKNERLFQLRNSATSKNMFGVFSGYALTVRNNYYDNMGAHPYWGPVRGVFEVDLIGTRNGEAGGYAYAQNIHEEDVSVPAQDDKPAQTVHSFLETSGNFVFPANETRKVVDNCFPTPYSDQTRDLAEGHYWYVTGFRYFYNVNITGYTYDTDVRYFDMDNRSHLIFLPGAKAGEDITIQSFHFVNRHSTDEKQQACDLENKFLPGEYNSTRWNEPTTEELKKYCVEGKCSHYDGTGTHLDDQRAYWIERSQSNDFANPFYNLSLSISDKDIYSPTTTVEGETVGVPHYEALIQDKFTYVNEPVLDADGNPVLDSEGNPKTVPVKKYELQDYTLKNKIPINEPLIAMQLKDVVQNNGKEADGTYYYDKYLSEPCQAVLVLTTPVKNSKGQHVYDAYEPVPKKNTSDDSQNLHDSDFTDDKYSVLDFNGDYVLLTADEAKEQYNKGNILYVTATATMLKVGDGDFVADRFYFVLKDGGTASNIGTLATKDYSQFTDGDNTGDWEICKLTREQFNALSDDAKGKLFYYRPAARMRSYEYNVTININYLKGPSYDGHIDVMNCALPGEMIRLRHNNLTVDSDPVSLPHNGSFWIVGPGKKVYDDPADPESYHWELIDQTGTYTQDRTGADGMTVTEHWFDTNTRNIYYPYNPWVDKIDEQHYKKAVGSIAMDGIYHDSQDSKKPDYYVPAYYFMNGYVVQYVYTVSNINEVFTTTINPMDTLLVHNYHRMLKANVETDKKEDIKLREAVLEMSKAPVFPVPDGATDDEKTEIERMQTAMNRQWAVQHKRPRVYIQNQQDLINFKTYVERTANRVVDGQTVLPATGYGEGIDFFLLGDVTVPDGWTPVSNFKGALHGNGHSISGLGDSKAKNADALFSALNDEVRIYNLGLPTGKIATTQNNAKYYCCYTYADKTVYRKDGTPRVYADDDAWRYGRVAYELNEFYLDERLDRNVNDSDDDNLTTHDKHDHSGYVESLYADGEYRYALYRLSDDPETEYLRSQQEPNYLWGYDKDLAQNPELATNHWYHYDEENRVLSHSVDEARAYYTEAVPAVLYADAAEYNTAKGTSLTDPQFAALSDAEKIKTAAKPRMVGEFRPLIDEVKVNSTEEGLTTKKNDYLFFGQTLNVSSVTAEEGTVGSSLPTVVSASANASQPGNSQGVTHAVNDQTNRVWRTYGFYKSKKDDAFHFNRDAWALHKDLTAIDFTGAHDDNHLWQTGIVAGGDNSEQFFYPMPMDVPKTDLGALYLTSFNVMSNRNYKADGTATAYDNVNYGAVTQNLLVYNKDEKKADGTDVFAYKDANNSAESAVQYHNIVFSGSPVEHYSTDFFHLVDKQDFNAPIAFNVNTRAWYERLPQTYRELIDDKYKSSSAWEGICIPFTATKVTAEKNGEISHFYGDTEGGYHTLHHEYWLQGFKGITDSNGETVATFVRPAVRGDNVFTDSHQRSASYVYPKNNYFTSLFNYNGHYDTRDDEGADVMGNHDKAWYAENHTFDDYVHLTAAFPYIVAFPGDDFYEFTMQSYYRTDQYGKVAYAQKATFEVNATSPETIAFAIPVTDDNAVTTTVDTHTHHGTYLHEKAMGVNADGTAFESGLDVLPFRTYMTTATPAQQHRVIRIADAGTSLIGEPESPKEELKTNYVKVWVEGHDIVVETSQQTALKLYTVSGMVLGDLNCKPGINRFPQAGSGIYIVGRKKLVIKR